MSVYCVTKQDSKNDSDGDSADDDMIGAILEWKKALVM